MHVHVHKPCVNIKSYPLIWLNTGQTTLHRLSREHQKLWPTQINQNMGNNREHQMKDLIACLGLYSLTWPHHFSYFHLWWQKKGLVTLPEIYCAVESPDFGEG